MANAGNLKIGMVGCGPRGRQHTQAALRTGLFTIAGAAEPDVARLEKYAKDFGLKATYTDYRAMFASGTRFDVVHLCTQPNQIRLEFVRAAIAAKARAVVVEKPIALNYPEALGMEQACREAGVLLVVNHQKRGDPEWVALKQAVQTGLLGKVTALRGNCYGNLMGQGTHLIDAVMCVLNEAKPLNVLAACDQTVGVPDSHPAPIQTVADIEFEGNVRGTFSIGERSPQFPNASSVWFNYSLDVLGTEGSARAVLNQGFWRWDKTGNLAHSFEVKWSGLGVGQEQLSRDIASALSDPTFKHPQRGELAIQSFAAMEACCRSAMGRRVVHLPLSADENALAHWSQRGQAKQVGAAQV